MRMSADVEPPTTSWMPFMPMTPVAVPALRVPSEAGLSMLVRSTVTAVVQAE